MAQPTDDDFFDKLSTLSFAGLFNVSTIVARWPQIFLPIISLQ